MYSDVPRGVKDYSKILGLSNWKYGGSVNEDGKSTVGKACTVHREADY